MPYLPSASDQAQALHHVTNVIYTSVEVNRAQHGFDRCTHGGRRDVTSLRWIGTNEFVKLMKSTNSVEVGI